MSVSGHGWDRIREQFTGAESGADRPSVPQPSAQDVNTVRAPPAAKEVATGRHLGNDAAAVVQRTRPQRRSRSRRTDRQRRSKGGNEGEGGRYFEEADARTGVVVSTEAVPLTARESAGGEMERNNEATERQTRHTWPRYLCVQPPQTGGGGFARSRVCVHQARWH